MTIKILLVDDNPTFRLAICKFLGTLPETKVIGQAANGPDALRKVEQLKPDLVLLDISMPGMSGLEVARSLQNQNPPSTTGVVFLTMHDTADYRAAAATVGALGLIVKDSLTVELPPVVERMLRNQSGEGAPC